jgi:hypothetical protein
MSRPGFVLDTTAGQSFLLSLFEGRFRGEVFRPAPWRRDRTLADLAVRGLSDAAVTAGELGDSGGLSSKVNLKNSILPVSRIE